MWRTHKRKYLASDPGGSHKVSGRYNRGLDKFPKGEVWPALYASLGAETCLGEILRHIDESTLPMLNDFRISELSVELTVVFDFRNPRLIGLSAGDLCHETDYRIPQELAAASIDRGAEAMLVPSATRLGDNLILFPSNIRPTSRIVVIDSRDPMLYVRH